MEKVVSEIRCSRFLLENLHELEIRKEMGRPEPGLPKTFSLQKRYQVNVAPRRMLRDSCQRFGLP